MAVKDNEMVNLNTDEEIKKVLDLLGLTGDTGGSATAGTAMAKLNELLSKNTSVIRHIQRGSVYMGVRGENDRTEKIKLSGFTDVDKIIVLLNGSLELYIGRDRAIGVLPYLESLSTTELVFSVSDNIAVLDRAMDGDISYQCIEFY